MDDDQEPGGPAEAFQDLRGEVFSLRDLVEDLARRGGAPATDYAPTLARIVEGVTILMREGVKLGEAPALKLTPETLAAQITAAGATVRRGDHDALTRAIGDLNGAMRDVRAIGASVLDAKQQRRRQLWCGLAGLVAGILLWMLLPGLMARELAPAGWHWPERLAQANLGADSMWDGARQMAAAGSPATWNSMMEGRALVQANGPVLQKCRKAEARLDRPVKCTIMTGPADAGDGR